MKTTNNKKAFSIIELLIGIFIFTLGMVSVYSLIISTINLNDYNKNYIIATNIARGQVELVRNIRDTNYSKTQKYNQINPPLSDYSNTIDIGKYYKIENDYSNNPGFPIKVTDITDGFTDSEDFLNGNIMQGYRLCLDSFNRYVYCTPGLEKTNFYKYIYIDEPKYSSGGTVEIINDAFLLKSRVIWSSNGYNYFELKSVIADWKRL